MKEYHKINTVFKRDMASPRKTIIVGKYSEPEFEYLAGANWTWTEKVDGTNIRVMITDGTVTFGGKTDGAQIPAPLVARLNDLFLSQSDRLVEMFPDGGCLYGEGYGAKIQKIGGNYRQDQDFVLFDVLVGAWWLQRGDVEDVAHKLGLDVVPVINCGTLHEAVARVQCGIQSMWGPFQAEGIVARPTLELQKRGGGRIITKIKTRDFSA